MGQSLENHIVNVGNFNPDLKHSEDEDMGKKTITKGIYSAF